MKVIELSVRIDQNTPVYPGDPKPEIEQYGTIETSGMNTKMLKFNSHFATHIDAPNHMIKGGKKLDQFPPSTFVGDGVVLDVCEPDLSLVREGDIVFFFTGNQEKQEFYEDKLAISKETAKSLIEKRIRMVGFDMPGPDYPPYELHKLFLSSDIPIVENLVNLSKIVNRRCRLIALPLFIRDSDGAPCRAVAILDQDM